MEKVTIHLNDGTSCEVDAHVLGPVAVHHQVAEGELMRRWVVTHCASGLRFDVLLPCPKAAAFDAGRVLAAKPVELERMAKLLLELRDLLADPAVKSPAVKRKRSAALRYYNEHFREDIEKAVSERWLRRLR